jgi:hypothetical protein
VDADGSAKRAVPLEIRLPQAMQVSVTEDSLVVDLID